MMDAKHNLTPNLRAADLAHVWHPFTPMRA
jgi:hypothetical protein